MSWWEEQRPQISRWVRLGITVPDTCLGQIKKSAPGSSRYVSPVHVTLASTCVMSGVVKQISRAISIHEYHWHLTNSLAPLQEVVKKYSGQLAFSCKKKRKQKLALPTVTVPRSFRARSVTTDVLTDKGSRLQTTQPLPPLLEHKLKPPS